MPLPPPDAADPVDALKDAIFPRGATEEQFIDAYAHGLRELEQFEFDLATRDEVHDRLLKAARKRAESLMCSWPECGEKSIRHSHVISLGVGIKTLAEGGKVVTPERLLRSEEPHSEPMATASTFPGYCREHEKEFSEFENRGSLDTARDFILQALRSADREVWWAASRDSFLGSVARARRWQIDHLAVSPAVDRVSRLVLDALHGVNVSTDMFFGGVIAIRSDLRAALKNPGYTPPFVQVFQDDVRAEVAVSGSKVHWYRGSGNRLRPTEILFISMPNKKGRLTVLASARTELAGFDDYLSSMEDTPDARTALIDQWMATTDHWFARPSWWAGQSEVTKALMLRRLNPFLVRSPSFVPPHRTG